MEDAQVRAAFALRLRALLKELDAATTSGNQERVNAALDSIAGFLAALNAYEDRTEPLPAPRGRYQ